MRTQMIYEDNVTTAERGEWWWWSLPGQVRVMVKREFTCEPERMMGHEQVTVAP